ncbi:hypothetical protein EJ08DRAFT_676920 [Tothia fuscella]|uniref:F-box domain-containing protein n=1 Tax=Tothia fuscella TaxID=1048955 RepID=A0A9P4NYH4_9PEZI|nr:hypothetical protein EJ08DRAFT_676920 [Tothia fuscella]
MGNRVDEGALPPWYLTTVIVNSNAAPNNKRASFLSLPSEIRQMIYGYTTPIDHTLYITELAISYPKPSILANTLYQRNEPNILPPIMRTNLTIFFESWKPFLQANRFGINSTKDIEYMTNMLSKQHNSQLYIRHLKFPTLFLSLPAISFSTAFALINSCPNLQTLSFVCAFWWLSPRYFDCTDHNTRLLTPPYTPEELMRSLKLDQLDGLQRLKRVKYVVEYVQGEENQKGEAVENGAKIVRPWLKEQGKGWEFVVKGHQLEEDWVSLMGSRNRWVDG